MSDTPFRLERARGDRWRAAWAEEGLRVVVAGGEDAPHPAHAATLRDLVTRWAEVREALERFVASLPPDACVPLQPPLSGAFAAGDCGFDGALRYEVLAVIDLDHPSRATVTFYTGLPDGYATYEVVLASGRPVSITAFCS